MKILMLILVVVGGSVLITYIDQLIGVKEAVQNLPRWAWVSHIVANGLWGAAILYFSRFLRS